jgi:hypothetical protein
MPDFISMRLWRSQRGWNARQAELPNRAKNARPKNEKRQWRE